MVVFLVVSLEQTRVKSFVLIELPSCVCLMGVAPSCILYTYSFDADLMFCARVPLFCEANH